MKLKLKPNRRVLIAVGVVAVVIFGLMANRSARDEQPGGMDSAAQQACADFAEGYPDAETKPERLALADKVLTSTRRTGNQQIADRAAEMGRTADDGGPAWRSSADALTSACRAAGWTAP